MTPLDPQTIRSIMVTSKEIARRRRAVVTPLREALECGAKDEIVIDLARKLVTLEDKPLSDASLVDEEQENLNEHDKDLGRSIWSQIEAQAGPEGRKAIARTLFSFARELGQKRRERLEDLRKALDQNDRDAIIKLSRYLTGLS